MAHLLASHIQDELAPFVDRFELFRRDTFVGAALQAEGGIQVAAEEVVLELGGLGQEVQELLARAARDVLGETGAVADDDSSQWATECWQRVGLLGEREASAAPLRPAFARAVAQHRLVERDRLHIAARMPHANQHAALIVIGVVG